jgi:hypothetical protein
LETIVDSTITIKLRAAMTLPLAILTREHYVAADAEVEEGDSYMQRVTDGPCRILASPVSPSLIKFGRERSARPVYQGTESTGGNPVR